MFGAPFLARSPCCGVDQCCPRVGYSDTQTTAKLTSAPFSKEQSYSLSWLCAGLHLWLPVYPHLLLCHSPVASGLEVIGWLMSCVWLCFKWRRFARSQPHFLVPVGLIQWQDEVKTAGDKRGCRNYQKVMNTPANYLQGSIPDFQLPTYTSWI